MLELPSRVFAAMCNLGLRSTVKLFVWHRLFQPSGTFSILIKKLDRPFFFRGNIDWGVLTHFYKPGYAIDDRASLRKVRTIIDAGANIGSETLRFRFFHPEAMIVAIEPENGNYDLLVKNVGPDRNIFPVRAGLHSRACKLKVINLGANHESFRIEELDSGVAAYDVIAISIPQLMERFHLTQIDILKLDIEGAERWVFDDTADAWIDKVKVIIFECPDSEAPGTTAQISARCDASSSASRPTCTAKTWF